MSPIFSDGRSSKPGYDSAAMCYINVPYLSAILADRAILETCHYGAAVIDRQVVTIGAVGPEIQVDANTRNQGAFDRMSDLLNELKSFLAQEGLVYI